MKRGVEMSTPVRRGVVGAVGSAREINERTGRGWNEERSLNIVSAM